MSGAIAGLVMSAGTTAMSFIGASKQKRMEEAASRSAAQAMAEVEKELTKNEMKALAIQQEPYEQMQDTLGAQIKTEMEAVREGDQRGVLGGSQRVQEGAVQASGSIRTAQGKEMSELDKLAADEETRKSDIRMQVKLGEVSGAQQASAQASNARAQLNQQALMGVGSTVAQGLQMLPTYGKSAEARDVAGMQRDFTKQQKADYLAGTGQFAGQGPRTAREYRQNLKPMMNQQFQQAVGGMGFSGEQFQKFGNIGQFGGLQQGQFSNLDFEQLGGLQGPEFMDQLMQMTPEQRLMLKQQLGF
jgi:hypothetical protein